MNRPTVGFIGTGRAGTALARALSSARYPVVAGWSRSTPALDRFTSVVPGARRCERPADVLENAELVFLTVPDSLIEVLAQSLPWDAGWTAVHCSGALSLDVLAAAAAEGAAIGSFHPLLPLASANVDLAGAAAAIEGDEHALPLLNEVAAALGMHPIHLHRGEKPLYHAAATLLSNYTVTLFDLAGRSLEQLGLSEAEARRSLLPLLRGVVANLEHSDPGVALTGPISRGDVETVRGHIRVLSEHDPSVLEAYRALGLRTVALARRASAIDEDKAIELEEVLTADQKEEVPA